MLAAWLRMRYPHLFDVAMATSAPVLMAGMGAHPAPGVSRYDFFRLVTEDFARSNSSCPALVRQGFDALLALAGAQRYGEIGARFRLCAGAAPAAPKDVQHMVFWLRNAFLSVAMGNYPPDWPVDAMCKVRHPAWRDIKRAFAPSVLLPCILFCYV